MSDTTDEEAAEIRRKMCDKLASCPVEALARLIDSAPEEKVELRITTTLYPTDGSAPTVIQITLQHAVNAPQPGAVPIPAEFYGSAHEEQN
jgi:hypothetical protein